MLRSIFTLLLFLLFLSCSRKQSHNLSESKISPYTPTLVIKSTNLSEDLSRLASQDDEILLLAYKSQDILTSPAIMEYLTFDKKHMLFEVPINKDDFIDDELILFILEIDTERRPNEIEKIVRKNVLALKNEFLKNNRIDINKILGDDDMLGVLRINKEKLELSQTYNIIGTHKMDRYEYELEFINIF